VVAIYAVLAGMAAHIDNIALQEDAVAALLALSEGPHAAVDIQAITRAHGMVPDSALDTNDATSDPICLHSAAARAMLHLTVAFAWANFRRWVRRRRRSVRR
jgi:sirohydrochlorin ferrochelatase